MLESLTHGGWENVPGIPGGSPTPNFTYLARGPCLRANIGEENTDISWIFTNCIASNKSNMLCLTIKPWVNSDLISITLLYMRHATMSIIPSLACAYNQHLFIGAVVVWLLSMCWQICKPSLPSAEQELKPWYCAYKHYIPANLGIKYDVSKRDTYVLPLVIKYAC